MNTIKGVTEDALIHTKEGYISIRDLINEDHKTVSLNQTRDFFHHYENEIVKVGDNIRIVNLVLTDYGSFKMTPNTVIYMKKGDCKQAKDITPQDILYGMPYYHKLKYIMKEGNADIYNLKMSCIHNLFIWDKNYLGDYTGILIKNLN